VTDGPVALHQVAQHVDDLDRAVGFYRDTIGLPLIATFDPPGLAFFDLGGTRLLLEAGAPSALLYLRVEDIDRRFDELRTAGVTFEGEPHLIHRDDDGRFGPAGNEEWMAFFRDSEQNLLALVERRLAPLNSA
jgi:methylmalonyl-CoA/ethylmalonyl-CoA epimerase